MNVYLYVLNTMADWEIGFLLAELNSKRYFKNRNDQLNVIKIGKTNQSITTMGGLTIQPDMSIDEMKIENDDLLLLPGADTWMNRENNEILLVAKKRIENGKYVAAICGATIGLANEGALNSIKHTSNDKEFLKMICPKYSGEIYYQEKPAITEKNLITASGIAPIDFSYEVLKMLNVFKKTTLEAWYNLYTKKETRYFYELTDSLKE
jgi:putative intracellular protease/amidase